MLKEKMLLSEANMGSPLEFYSMRSQFDETSNAPINNVFWRSAKQPAGVGPFDSLSAAMKHYAQVTHFEKLERHQACKEAPLADSNNVIHVDFANKRRL